MEAYQPILIFAVTAIAALLLAALVVAVVRRRRASAEPAPLPLIPFATGRGTPPPPRPDVASPAHGTYAPPVDRGDDTTPKWSPAASDAPPTRSPYAPPVAPAGGARTPRAGGAGGAGAPGVDTALAQTAMPNDYVTGQAVEGAAVRYWRPADGTLQFLPGRLEVVAGRDAGQEIRFVRTPGPDGTSVTFGRAEGAPYRHVQLREPTVSRNHARMTLIAPGTGPDRATPAPGAGPCWRLENLSATNPVIINGQPLAADGGAGCSVVLSDGDRIEMGEVVFRFHAR